MLNNKGLKALNQLFIQCPCSLNTLKLNCDALASNIFDPRSMTKLSSNIQILNISGNLISKSDVGSFSDVLIQMNKLEEINLQGNNFNPSDISVSNTVTTYHQIRFTYLLSYYIF